MPAQGSLKLHLKGDQPLDITDLAIDGDGFSIAGGATFAPDGKSIGKLSLKKANIAKSAITDLVADFSNNATNVSVGGGVSLNLISSENPSSIAANIALNFPESSGVAVNTLIASGLALFAITLIVNMAARALIGKRVPV